MRDFPMFPTDFGLSSLILREIPYRKEAYIHILDLQEGMLEPHLAECAGFCRMAGAEKIYATGMGLDGFPDYMDVLEMRVVAWSDPEMAASLFPVTEATVSQWRELYNRSMAQVDTAQTLEKRDEKNLLESCGVYFVHEDRQLLGIGWVEDGKLLAVSALQKGAGERVMHSLMGLCQGQSLSLEVASTNRRAIALYERLGFIPVGVAKRWYRISG